MKKHFFSYAAGPFLVVFLLLLLGSSYISQQNLQQASDDALLFNLKKRASALSYFHSERQNDLHTLAEDPALSAFFSNRALGMSMESGLQANLLAVQERFQEILDDKKLEDAPIYLRLLFKENSGNTLVDIGLPNTNCNYPLTKEATKIEKTTTFISQDGKHNHSIILCPYFFNGKRMGTLIAEVNRDEMIRYLIRSDPSENTQYAVLASDPKHILKDASLEKEPSDSNNQVLLSLTGEPVDTLASLKKVPISGTPLVLAAGYHKGALDTFLTSRWYLISLIFLALLVLSSVVMGVRDHTHTLLLRTRFEEAERQKTMVNEKNTLLEEEVQKRLTSETRLKALVETIPDLIWLKDLKGIYLSCNHKVERFLGACEEDIVGKTDYDFLKKEVASFFREKDKAVMALGEPLVYEERIIYADDGHEELVETIKTPLRDNDGKLLGVLGVARDITVRKQAEDKALYLSLHDPLTGLYNRRVLEERIDQEINRAERYERSLSVFMVDLDHFKRVNDTYGHKSGDIVLCRIAKVLESSIRKTDYVARYGGEEFVVVLPETPLSVAFELAERLCEQIAECHIPISNTQTIQLTASIGVSCFPDHHHTWEGLIETADAAMYCAKRAGRNRVRSPLTEHFFFI